MPSFSTYKTIAMLYYIKKEKNGSPFERTATKIQNTRREPPSRKRNAEKSIPPGSLIQINPPEERGHSSTGSDQFASHLANWNTRQ